MDRGKGGLVYVGMRVFQGNKRGDMAICNS